MQNFKMVAAVPNPNLETPSLDDSQPPALKRLISVPNFRLLCSGSKCSLVQQRSPSVFRSSRPDLIGQGELSSFKQLGIQSIIDFRSKQEYLTADGNHLLDQEYHLYNVKLPKGRNFRHGEPVRFQRIAPSRLDYPENVDSSCRHYLINFFTLNYIWKVFNRAPWYIRLYSLLLLFYDFVFQTGHKHFVRLFARTTLNSTGILGQYKDIIEYSQRSICAALKLLCDSSNLPALLNCAHGKDRTGIVSALVLSCLGKSPEYIAAEYALSAEGLAPVRKRLHSEVVERFHMSEDFISAHSETMQQLFGYIRERYGSVENYLEYIGFGSCEQENLRRNFLDECNAISPNQSSDGSFSKHRVD